MKTLISIIVINFNREKYLERCLRSCSDQIIFNKNFEVIFVDDGSNDNSWKIAKKFISTIKIFRLKKNMGIPFASNFALRKSQGKFVIRVDSDDFLNKHALDIMSEILIHNDNYAFVCCDHYKVDEIGYKEEKIKLNNLNKIKNHGAGIMFRKKTLKEFNYFNLKMKEAEDYEIISKILKKKYKYFYLPLPLYRYYQHDQNISKSGL
jgi:glycosyltransferase involved in cell wall biosynthesis